MIGSLKTILAKTFLPSTVVYKVARSDKVFLTFDDGPHPQVTPLILDVLDRHAVKATFFMVGRDVRGNESLVRDVVARGHTLANHSLTHPRMDRMSLDACALEVRAMDRLMEEFGAAYVPQLFRPPYGYVSVRTVQSVRRLGRKMIMWTQDSMDFRADSAQVIREFDGRNPSAGDILLFHDDSQAAAPALDVLLPRWQAAGAKFGTLEDIFK